MAYIGKKPTDVPLAASDLAADVITGAKIADDAIDSEHYTDVSIDAAHIASNAVTSAKINADAVTGAKIADDAIDSEHYAAGSIDTAHIADNQITLAKMAGGTDGQIITYDASGDPVAVGPGTDGQVLTSTGAGSPPAFEAAGGGAWNFIASGTNSGGSNVASITFTSGITSTYSMYVFSLKNIVPVTAGDLVMHFSTDAGSSYLTGSFNTTTWGYDAGGTSRSNFGTTADGCHLADQVDLDALSGVSGMVYMVDPSDSGIRPNSHWNLGGHSNIASEYACFQSGCGFRTSGATVTGVKFEFTSGNIETGEIRMYGIVDS